ncbi:MAG: hypothetical protein M9951_16885 [Burkholderiaceae bacterium]|nr:hypothetical protein [Burkholderiaceae bacterium]
MAALIAWIAFAGGAWIIGYQAYHWLHSAVWHGLSVVQALHYVLPGNEWLVHPTSWLGVHAALRWMPASGLLIAVAVVAMLLVTDDGPDRRRLQSSGAG